MQLAWRLPVQMNFGTMPFLATRYLMLSTIAVLSQPPIHYFILPVSIDLVLRFAGLLILHLTPMILVGALLSIVNRQTRLVSLGTFLVVVIGALGTIFVFAALSRTTEVLISEYFYSNSRFLLSLVGITVVAAAGTLDRLLDLPSVSSIKVSNLTVSKKKGAACILGLVTCLSFVPNYAAIPSGIDLISHETRFGWVGLPDAVMDLTQPSDIILAERARELAWLSRRQTVHPRFVVGASTALSLGRIDYLSKVFDAQFFVIEGYTIARWKTLGELLHLPLAIGGEIPMGIGGIDFTANASFVNCLALVYQTLPNRNGDYARLYSIGTTEFRRVLDINILDEGWVLGNGGSLKNESHLARLEIGHGRNYTFSWRPNGFDLALDSVSGFISLKFQEVSATIARVEFYDAEGEFMGYSSDVGNGWHFQITGDAIIGDIRIVVEGESGGYVLVQSASLWQSI